MSTCRDPKFSPETNAIVVGYGRFGQTVAQMLMAKRIPVTLIDINAEQIELAGQFDTKVYYGDGTRIDLLRTAGAEDGGRDLLLHRRCRDLAPDRLGPIVEAFPKAKIMVRTFDRRQMLALKGLGLSLDAARSVRQRGGDGPRRRWRRWASPFARSTGSSRNIAAATASG